MFTGTHGVNLLICSFPFCRRSFYLPFVPYPPAPTEFEDVIRLIPFRGTITKNRFMIIDKPFELRIGRNESNIVFLEFCVPVERVAY